jgi:hypothetical protein
LGFFCGAWLPCRGYVDAEPDLASIRELGVEVGAHATRSISGHNIIIKSRQAGEHDVMH